MHRREFLGSAALLAAGAAFMPRLAFAKGAVPDLVAHQRAFADRWVGVGAGQFPGLACSFGVAGQPTQFVVKGTEGFTDADVLTPDSLFRIYSMTKPVTGMAAMILIDEGKLGLDQPVADILPKFAKMQVQVTPDGSITDLRPARTPITIRHLLTHTSGLGYSIVQKGPLKQAFEDAGLVPGLISRANVPGLFRGVAVSGLATFADRLAAMPLVYEPGTRWSYSVGLDLMGRVIEVVSGQSFDAFLRRRIFAPCGMNSTFFQVPASQAHRLTTNYAALGDTLVPIDKGADSVFLDKPPSPFGGAGLVSSPRDYDRFLAMLTGYGRIGGRRVMSEHAVRMGTSNLLPGGVGGQDFAGMSGDFGAGGRVGRGAEAGTFGWGGAAGTLANVDMRRGLRAALFVQFMPPNAIALHADYLKALQADADADAPRAAG